MVTVHPILRPHSDGKGCTFYHYIQLNRWTWECQVTIFEYPHIYLWYLNHWDWEPFWLHHEYCRLFPRHSSPLIYRNSWSHFNARMLKWTFYWYHTFSNWYVHLFVVKRLLIQFKLSHFNWYFLVYFFNFFFIVVMLHYCVR